MTPIAQLIVRAILKGKAPPKLVETAQAILPGAHFFEAMGALPLVDEIDNAIARRSEHDDEPFTPGTFLPAPKTWIEWRVNGVRHAVVFLSDDIPGIADPGTVAVVVYFRAFTTGVIVQVVGTVDLKRGLPALIGYKDAPGVVPEEERAQCLATAFCLLTVINSPRVVSRRTHHPHKGLARELKRLPGGIGPLHDWHEIKLEINKPRDICDGEAHRDVITGKRALHFCRKHLRLWNGRLILVREHWRGEMAVGIRRGRYVVTVGEGTA